MTLGAFKRYEIPAGLIQKVGGLEFAVQIPQSIWEKSARRLIDTDESLLFKLALRRSARALDNTTSRSNPPVLTFAAM